jgi:integrase
MRASEPIDNAQWQHVDWERRVIRLPDSKDGGREVPLSPKAIAALKELRAAHAPEQPVPTDPIICSSASPTSLSRPPGGALASAPASRICGCMACATPQPRASHWQAVTCSW